MPQQPKSLQEMLREVETIRRELAAAGYRNVNIDSLLTRISADLSAGNARNADLMRVLREAREQIVTLKTEMDRLAQPPAAFGVILWIYQDGTVDILTGGRKLHVQVSPSIEAGELERGREVWLNEAMNVTTVLGFERTGKLYAVKEDLGDHKLLGPRALVTSNADDERVVMLAAPVCRLKIRVGDSLLVDERTGFALELIPKSEINDLLLEELPDVDFAQIGGLSSQIEAIRDAVELPYLHPELFTQHRLKPPKGVLLYGPPGCGKTMIAKAVANGLARRVQEQSGDKNIRAYFISVKGPELLNKYVGETERHIRLIFARAREKASEGPPVVIFFDEMESLFRTRGSGVSSDVETTIVPQLLAEMDGVESLDNVLVIGASNREDMIDPAILRPGRLDVKIKVQRPDAEAARDIFSIYLTPDLPFRKDWLQQFDGDVVRAVKEMVEDTVTRMYAEEPSNRFLEVTYVNGEQEILYFKDFSSGAMIQNIVDRAKKMAIKDFLEHNVRGICPSHLVQAVVDEFKENEDLPNTTNPDDWARISGKKGLRITYIRTLIRDPKEEEKLQGKHIDTVGPTGQYL